jgi:hypothetical protein
MPDLPNLYCVKCTVFLEGVLLPSYSGMHKTSKKLSNYEAIGYPRNHGIIDAFPELDPIINSRMKIMEEP